MNKSPVACYTLLILIKAMHAKASQTDTIFNQHITAGVMRHQSSHTNTNIRPPNVEREGIFKERARRVHSQQPVYFAWACVCTCFFDIHSQSPENPLRTQPFSCMHITFIKQRRRPSVSALAAKRALLLFNSINGSLFASPFVSSGLIASASESRVRPIHRL